MGKLNIMHMVYDLEIGGAQTQILTILQNIDKSKYNPYVLTIVASGILKDEFIKAGVTVIELGRKKIYDIFCNWS